MVCLGNICRSPLAEGILQAKADRANLGWTVESAGTNGFHTGEAPHRFSQKVASLNGIDISKQVARRFVKADLDRYDKIFVMAADVVEEMKQIIGTEIPSNVRFFLDSLHAGKNMDVPDPWYGDEDGYHEVYKLIDTACDAIISQHLAEKRQTQES